MANLGHLLRVGLEGRLQDRSSRWSIDQLHRHQARALARLRRYAAEHSPYYRARHRGLGSAPLEALPILSKAELMAEFDRVLTVPGLSLQALEDHLAGPQAHLPFQGRYTVLATSGSTGRRGVFVFDRREWLQALGAITRPLAWAGAPAPWARPRAALIAASADWHYSAQVGRALASRWLPSLRLDAGTPLNELVERLNDWQPTSLATYPSVLRQLADAQLRGRLRIAPAHVGTSAERLPDATRALVRQAWGVTVFDTYGATEYAPIAAQCREGRLHLLEDRALIEIVDDRGAAVPPGEPGARLLLTLLDRRTQPLIRYELSDGVREVPGRCRCGRPFRMLEGIDGRVEESLSFRSAHGPGTVQLHPNCFHDLLERVPAAGWQVRQGAGGELTVLLAGKPDAAARLALQQSLAALLASRGAACAAPAVRWVSALPRGASGKAPLIVAGASALHLEPYEEQVV